MELAAAATQCPAQAQDEPLAYPGVATPESPLNRAADYKLQRN
jgi:hypothetical protein